MPWSKLRWVVLALLIAGLLLCFALVYALIPVTDFYESALGESNALGAGRLGFGKGLYVSITVQTLLGTGDIVPLSHLGRAAYATQSLSTLVLLVLTAFLFSK